ncbi:MAG: serine hydrolase [Clostridia bacterium]|nr:serine hydrolase [Clostridia bacterium]
MLYYTEPEQAGIPSGAIERFIDRLEGSRLCMHDFVMIKNGGILAEAYWKPFHADRKHRMYSVSKSFVSIAVGVMIGEGRLSLEDHVADYFPEKLPENPHPYILEMTVRDLLMMSTCHNRCSYDNRDADWVATFFNRKPSHRAGRVFSYDTAATVVLNAIVEKLAGEPFLEYLRPRFLDPLGVSKDVWCVQRPEGGSWGGSGVMVTAMDLARVAQCCMHGGKHEGKQLIPEWYIREATTRQIDNRTSEADPEWQFGYGYQFWCTRNGGFAMNGMGSQFAICLPKYDFILITNGDTQEVKTGASVILNALWTEVYPYLDGSRAMPAAGDSEALKRRIEGLHVMPECGGLTSTRAAEWNGAKFIMDENPMGIKWMRFVFADGEATMQYENEQGECELKFAIGGVHAQKFPQKNYYGKQIRHIPGIQYDCLCTAAWADETSLAAHVWVTDDYFGSVKMHIVFEDDTVTVIMQKTAEWFLEEYQGFASGMREK